jgi:hypothetical protein
MKPLHHFLFLSLLAIAFSYCKKEAETFIFTEKPYNLTSEAVIKAKVSTFVEHLTSNVPERTPFPNTEVNEAKWDLEAAANFLYNDNLGEKEITETQTFTLSIPNITEGGVLKMVGTEMTTKFSEILAQISTYETQTGTVGTFADFKIEQVSATSSQITATIAFAKDTQNAVHSSFEVAAEYATVEVIQIINSLPQPACMLWNPSVTIHYFTHDNMFQEEPPGHVVGVLPLFSGLVMNRYQGLEHDPLYPPSWYPNDIATGYAIAQQKLANFNASQPTQPPSYLRKVGINAASWLSPAGFEKSLYVSVVVARNGVIGICYEE